MALTPEQIATDLIGTPESHPFRHLMVEVVRKVMVEVRKDDEALIRQMRNALYALPLPYTSETRAALQAGNEWLDAAIAERARLEKAP